MKVQPKPDLSRPITIGRVGVVGLLAFASCETALAGDVWSTPVTTPSAIAACGIGGYALGGTGCLRISGSVAASIGTRSFSTPDMRLSQPNGGGSTLRLSGTRLSEPTTQGRVAADVRLPTELGPVRAYVSVRSLPSR